MRRTEYDPLKTLPSARALREKLSETERLAERLRIALELAERVEATERADYREAVADAR